MSNERLSAPYGALIDRTKAVSFTHEDKTFKGFKGDTVASALAANGEFLLSRSFKYHRPRGALSMAGQDANTLMQINKDGNALADRVPISEGMSVQGQNYIGSLKGDVGRAFGLFSKFLPVGFYYKAFFKPVGMWERWAPLFRKITGLGDIDQQHEPAYFDKQFRFYDVVVVGAGPAGLSAALKAAETGAEVLLIDENPALGGSLLYSRLYDTKPDEHEDHAAELLAQLLEKVTLSHTISVMSDAVCNAWYSDNWLAVIQAQRLFKVRAKEVIMCVGSMEQLAIFRNNDLPGVMMSSAALRMLKLYAIAPGKRAVVLTGNTEGYACALELADAGVEVACLVDMRSEATNEAMAKAVTNRGIKTVFKQTVFEARAGSNKNHLGHVSLREIVAQGRCADIDDSVIDCDLLCMAVGYMPTYQLICQAGGTLAYNDESDQFSLSNLPESFQIAGSVNGHWAIDDVIADGKFAAQTAMARWVEGLTTDCAPPRENEYSTSDTTNYTWPIFPHPKGKEFVDLDEDLQIADIVNATLDGFEHVQLVKRYSTCGMGPSQGRHSALPTARLVARSVGKTVSETGVTTARPPFAPERLAHNAGRSFYPARRSAMHYRHIEAGAQMLQAGDWYRPAYYGLPAERELSINAEVTNVRTNVGVVDVSTLGGLEVRGADAAEFLNRFYTFGFVKQPIGRARYALLCNEAGVVIDDGVACRLSEQHYYVTATTGGVGRVFQQMLKWNAQWCLDVDIANVTTAWCGVNIAGPNARKVLEKLAPDIALDQESFPYMGVREGMVAGIPARLLRVGFVGELGYEIHAPQHAGEALWDALLDAGNSVNIKPFGIEAQRILRLEKGHIIIGQDTDAMSNPMEVQMTWALGRKKPFFIGARTINELEKTPLERVLVGFCVNDASAPIPLESHLVLDGEHMIGRVTSCNFSPTLKKAIGLAYVPPNLASPGATVWIKSSGGVQVQAEVVSLPFYDPELLRQEV